MTTETGKQRAKRMALDVVLVVTFPVWAPVLLAGFVLAVAVRMCVRWWLNDPTWDYD